jgi:hypothetical protein
MTGNEIAAAFMQQNEKRTWKARCVSRQGKGDTVYFESQGGMVALVYTPDDGRFAVKFTKFQGAWGDYIKAIARSLFTVLNTLKSAGLPFDAPPTLAGMAIEATTTDDNLTYVRWPGTPGPQPVQEGLDDLGEHLEGAGFERAELEGLPEGVTAFVGKLPPVL